MKQNYLAPLTESDSAHSVTIHTVWYRMRPAVQKLIKGIGESSVNEMGTWVRHEYMLA